MSRPKTIGSIMSGSSEQDALSPRELLVYGRQYSRQASPLLPYIGGVGTYRRICEEVVADNYEGFRFEAETAATAAE